jgi:hypothetical protein
VNCFVKPAQGLATSFVDATADQLTQIGIHLSFQKRRICASFHFLTASFFLPEKVFVNFSTFKDTKNN